MLPELRPPWSQSGTGRAAEHLDLACHLNGICQGRWRIPDLESFMQPFRYVVRSSLQIQSLASYCVRTSGPPRLPYGAQHTLQENVVADDKPVYR